MIHEKFPTLTKKTHIPHTAVRGCSIRFGKRVWGARKSENNQWKQHPTHPHWNKEASKA